MAAEQSAVSAVSAARPPPVVPLLPRGRDGAALRAVPLGAAGAPSEAAVEHFLKAGRLAARDGAEIRWWHAANSRRRAREAARSAVHMVEADVLLRGGRGGDGDPIMAHPPETDSDITLQEWLEEMAGTDKGIKLDFKSLDAVRPSLELLQLVKPCLERPVWLNADVLPGPNGINAVVDAEGFLEIVTSFFPDVTLSLGWTTGWHPEQHNEVTEQSAASPSIQCSHVRKLVKLLKCSFFLLSTLNNTFIFMHVMQYNKSTFLFFFFPPEIRYL
ncbi:protein FAM151B isoform X1 [Gallus gallus]|uniref:protein FAM151B isoform X1 n=1 Tax=Gallus gallus TaxID=9031 RepID=UPI001AE5562E|nr:protein FAM151B isoform X1 [Gallus gallus]XP_046793003.1 protein FAM151B isoform X1 [Gallus gallus]